MNDQCNTCEFYDCNTKKCKLRTDWVYADFRCPKETLKEETKEQCKIV